jgi:lipid A ethanolaminephosphotransferase
MRECTPQQVVNAYDNTLLYTDHVLAQTIAFLRAQQARFDTAMVYVSDHGESLGEEGLYLHGLPWSIAPAEQTHVPMLMWLSPGFARSFALDTPCLRARAARPASHDNLFHTVLGLLDVHTALHEPALDLAAGCRAAG